MADKKLFELVVGTPVDSDKIAYGKAGSTYKNITVADFRTSMQGATAAHKFVTAEIGAWNMNTSSISPLVQINHALLPGQFFPLRVLPEKFRGVAVIIRNDANTQFSDFLSVQDGSALTVPQIQIGTLSFIFTSTVVTLQRRTNSWYDDANFQKTANPDTSPYNRGWITVTYVD